MESAEAVEVRSGPTGRARGRRRVGVAINLVCALLLVAGCGNSGGGGRAPLFVSHIVSNPRFDGDIEQIFPASYIVTQGMTPSIQSVLAGSDPSARSEFRAFLNFPLGGPGGVPANAIIDSAFLEVLVDNVIPFNGSVPILVELVAFQPPTLIGTDFDRTFLPPLASALVSGNVTAADIGQFVPVDVTTLMIRAQQRGLLDFQVRILENLGPSNFTLMEVDDPITVDRPQRAPLLTVNWR